MAIQSDENTQSKTTEGVPTYIVDEYECVPVS